MASPLVRRAAEAMLRASGRRHLARISRLAPEQCQRRILYGLLHQAQTTRFGLEHDFRRIRGVADYRRLVPLTTRAELWRDYCQPVFPHLAGATWPAENNLSCGHRSALRTALALIAEARPRRRLLSGAWLFLSDVGPSSRTEGAFLAERLPALLRPYTVASTGIEAEHFAHLPITGLIGPVERLHSLFEQIKQIRGKHSVRDVWPELAVILYTRRPDAVEPAPLRAEVGDDVLFLELIGRSEGSIAIEDPKWGLSRLLFDHGVYFEFVPPDRIGEPRCPRYDIGEIERGIPYELALTSPAGLWACRVGRTVCLERHDPPLVRFIEPALLHPLAASGRRLARRTDLVLPTPPLPAPYPQNAGTPATPPENSSHTPWSILADRG